MSNELMQDAIVLQGDCLEVLRDLPDDSADSMVTDPPAFIDFMGKSWDGTDILWRYLWSSSTFVANVQLFLKRTRVEKNMAELNFAQKNVNTQATLNQHDSANYVNPVLHLTNPMTNASVELLVLTKRELLDSLSESLPNLMQYFEGFLSGENDNAYYVVPLLMPEPATTNTVPKSVVTNIKKLSKQGPVIQLTLMAVQKIKDAIEDRIGIKLESRFSKEIIDNVNIVKKDRSDEKYSVITLSPIDLQKIIPYLTLLLSALVVTEKSKNIQSYLASNFMESVMRECLRVLKPGAHALVWAIPRTSHWTATALEGAGFEIRDVVTHVFGSGFPKSMNISIAIDKQAGAIGARGRALVSAGKGERKDLQDNKGNWTEPNEHVGITPEAKRYQGFGTALKPASEHWILARKPLSEKTVAKNVLKHGVGGLNIDASRVATEEKMQSGRHIQKKREYPSGYKDTNRTEFTQNAQGRFPANFVLSHTDYCTDKQCDLECAVKMLDEQSGQLSPGHYADKTIGFNKREYNGPGRKTDSGAASRFFYCAKASKSDKNAGLDKPSTHPTVKSTKLMTYLIRMITPPNGLVLDPFTGSGSTGVAAIKSGFSFLGIEREEEYVKIAEARIEHTKNSLLAPQAEEKTEELEEAEETA